MEEEIKQHKKGKRDGGAGAPRNKKGYLSEQTLSHYRRISDSLNEPRTDEDRSSSTIETTPKTKKKTQTKVNSGKVYRERRKLQPSLHAAFRAYNNLLFKRYQQEQLTEAELEIRRQRGRERVRKHREKKKAEEEALGITKERKQRICVKVKAKKTAEEKREFWRQQKQSQRQRWTAEKWQQHREDCALYKLKKLHGIFLNHAFSCLAEEAEHVGQNQTVSLIIESLIRVGSPSNLRVLFAACADHLSVFFLDRFASHVFETLLQRLPQFFNQVVPSAKDNQDDDDDNNDEHEDVDQVTFVEKFESVCRFVDTNFEDVVTHVYGSHVYRALLEGLSGVQVAHDLKKSLKMKQQSNATKTEPPAALLKEKLPEQFMVRFEQYSTKTFNFCDYEVHLKDPYFSLSLQALLLIWHKVDDSQCQCHCRKIVDQVVQSCPQTDDPTQSVADLAQDAAGSHLLETMFRLGCRELLQHVFEALLGGRLLFYAIHPTANYVLQSFIASVRDQELMLKLFEELCKNLEDVFAVGYMGLVNALAGACRRLRIKQDEFIMKLMECFHCKEPKERQRSLVKLIASLTTYEVFYDLKEESTQPAEEKKDPLLSGPVHVQGSLLLQQLLQFQKPSHAALGVVDLSAEDLKTLCCDPSGSHVVDVFFSSSSVLEKNKDNVLKKLKGWLVEIACSKNGSRCLESVWKRLNVKQRTRLAEELAESDRLRNDRFGHFLFRNFQLGLFLQKRASWLERQGVQSKRQRQMRELLHSIEPPVKKMKKDSEKEDPSFQDDDEDQPVDSITAMFLQQKAKSERKTQQQESTASVDSSREGDSSGGGGDSFGGGGDSFPPKPRSHTATSSVVGKREKKKKLKKKAKAPFDGVDADSDSEVGVVTSGKTKSTSVGEKGGISLSKKEKKLKKEAKVMVPSDGVDADSDSEVAVVSSGKKKSTSVGEKARIALSKKEKKRKKSKKERGQ